MGKKIIVVADSGSIISLAIIEKLNVLRQLFDEILIPKAVFEELMKLENKINIIEIKSFFKNKIREIKRQNDLILLMDYGESEAVILCKEINANYLIIDDKKARMIAENFNIICIGTLGILFKAKEIGLIKELRPLFIKLIEENRYYSKSILNELLNKANEPLLN